MIELLLVMAGKAILVVFVVLMLLALVIFAPEIGSFFSSADKLEEELQAKADAKEANELASSKALKRRLADEEYVKNKMTGL